MNMQNNIFNKKYKSRGLRKLVDNKNNVSDSDSITSSLQDLLKNDKIDEKYLNKSTNQFQQPNTTSFLKGNSNMAFNPNMFNPNNICIFIK